MGEIIFKNTPPYNRLDARSPTALGKLDGVELTLNVFVADQLTETVPVLVRLTPEDARTASVVLGIAAGQTERWQRQEGH